MCLSLAMSRFEVRMHKSEGVPCREYEKGIEFGQWMTLKVERISVEVKNMTFDTKVRVRLKKLCLRETERLHEDILRNDGVGNFCEIDVDNFGIFSPNI